MTEEETLGKQLFKIVNEGESKRRKIAEEQSKFLIPTLTNCIVDHVKRNQKSSGSFVISPHPSISFPHEHTILHQSDLLQEIISDHFEKENISLSLSFKKVVLDDGSRRVKVEVSFTLNKC